MSRLRFRDIESEHVFRLQEWGPPHEHDAYVCECGAQTFYTYVCQRCGPSRSMGVTDLHCSARCEGDIGGTCILDLVTPAGHGYWNVDQ